MIDSGDTAWLLASAAMVMLMTPGLALFYGGLVHAKSVINMMMMSFVAIGVVTLTWVTIGYSLVFKGDNPLVGNLDAFWLEGGILGASSGSVPELAFCAFQMMFAVITVALISGSVADRMRFGAWIAFAAIWTVVCYIPVARWVFNLEHGWIASNLGALDFAGGTAVHINAGAAGLALALVLGKRVHRLHGEIRPHNLPLVILGAGLLWFGWFGFNAGSALTANGLASIAFVNTQTAAGAGVLGWLMIERLRSGRWSALGAASGAVAGLVAVTPAAGAVNPVGALCIGLLAGWFCAQAVGLKGRLGVDDTLDVSGVHLVGGLIGTVLIGLYATAEITGGPAGLLHGGGFAQLGKQIVAALAVAVYSFVVTWLIAKALDWILPRGLRVLPHHEVNGIDLALHDETAYALDHMR